MKNTHETYVSLEVAKLLKQAGFDWDCSSYYAALVRLGDTNQTCAEYELLQNTCKLEYDRKTDKHVIVSDITNHNEECETEYPHYSAPTLAVAEKWLREVKGWDIDVTTNREHIGVFYECTCIDKNVKVFNQQSGKDITPFLFDTYEEALEAGIKKCLTLILEQK